MIDKTIIDESIIDTLFWAYTDIDAHKSVVVIQVKMLLLLGHCKYQRQRWALIHLKCCISVACI